jgi:aromatic-L-amino-acid decarboxylase
MVAEDRAAGRRPFMVIATAGTTNTGAVDPIARIGELARSEDLWLHVDAAYGGPFQLTAHGRGLFHGIELADSITLDPHKAFFVPYGTGALLVRDGARLRDAHHVPADYLQDLDGPEGPIPNASEYSMELSRDFRGLRLWLPLKLHGFAAFRAALEEKLELASTPVRRFSSASPGFEVGRSSRRSRPSPSATVPSSGDPDASTEAPAAHQRVAAHLPVVHDAADRFMIRACVVSHRTHGSVEEASAVIRDARTSWLRLERCLTRLCCVTVRRQRSVPYDLGRRQP